MGELAGIMVGCTRASSAPSHGLGDGEELDAVAQLHRVLHVLLGDGGDALGVDVLEIDRGAEGEGGEDLELVGRIHPFDVEGGIGLGVALRPALP